MQNIGLNSYILEMCKFADTHKLEHHQTDWGIAIKNAEGDYIIHIFVCFDVYGRTYVRTTGL